MIEYEDLQKLNQPFSEAFKEDFRQSLDAGWYILGKKVAEFEKAYASFIGSEYCIGLASGLDALVLALRCFDLPEGSEIIVPSNTYIATILSIVQNRCVPVLVEPDIHTYNIDPAKIEEKITTKTKAIMVVHLYGKPCRMDQIMDIANKYDLKVVEDCAQSHGATFKNTVTGKFGDIGAHSFYPTKNLGALGDAGAATTNNVAYSDKLRSLRNYGSKVKYINDLVGYNSRLDEVQAGFLFIKLKAIDCITTHKRTLARLYLEHLKDDFIKPVVEADCKDVYHIFSIRHPWRDDLREYLLKNEIKTEIHYPIAPHRQKAMQGIITGEYPISEEIHATTLSLPISFYHRPEDIHRVIEVLNAY